MQFCGREIEEYIQKSAQFSSTKEGVTRLYCSLEHKNFAKTLTKWMNEAGLKVHMDALGNIIGRLEGQKTTKTLIIGSHQDSVIEGGAYDGILGILLPLYILKKFKESDIKLDYSIELIAFGDEEGVRFPETLLGSKALSGHVTKDMLKACDKDNISISKALDFLVTDITKLKEAQRNPKEILGYFETHIEQGPLLEEKNIAVGVVDAITSIERHHVHIKGQANHAGTTPMHLRKDALVGAAKLIEYVDKLCKETDALVGVVGQIDVHPNAVNVIPDEVNMTIELRSPSEEIKQKAQEKIRQYIQHIAQDYRLSMKMKKNYEMKGAKCSPYFTEQLKAAIISQNITPITLFSGAGHDGLAVSALTPISMLFIRCKDGLSHHKDEYVSPQDMEIAAYVIQHFLQNFKAN